MSTKISAILMVALLLAGCVPATAIQTSTPSTTPTPQFTPTPPATYTPSPTPTQLPAAIQGTPLPDSKTISVENAHEVTKLAKWGQGKYFGFSWLPEGQNLIGATTLGISKFDMNDPTKAGATEPSLALENMAIFTSDGEIMASIPGYIEYIPEVYGPKPVWSYPNAKSSVRLWRVSDGELLHELGAEFRSPIVSLAISPNGEILAAGFADKTVRVWRVVDEMLLYTFDDYTAIIWSLAFSPDGATLATGTENGTLQIWNLTDGSLIRTTEIGQEDMLLSLAYSPDGTSLAAGTYSGKIFLWNTQDGKQLKKLGQQDNIVFSVAFSPDGAYLASGKLDGNAQLWSVNTGTLLRVFHGNIFSIKSVNFSPDGQLLATQGFRGKVQIWKVGEGRLAYTVGDSNIRDMDISPDGKMLALASRDQIQLIRVNDGVELKKWDGGEEGTTTLAFSPDGTQLATGLNDGSILVWETRDWTLFKTYGDPTTDYDRFQHGTVNNITDLAYSPDGKMIALASINDYIVLFSTSCDPSCREWHTHTSEYLYFGPLINSITFFPDGKVFAYSIPPDTVRFQVPFSEEPSITFQTDRTQPPHSEYYFINVLLFSPDGKLLAIGAEDGSVELINAANKKLLKALFTSGGIRSIAFTPDGNLIAAGSLDGTIRLWNVETGALLVTLSDHTGLVSGLKFSPDGSLLFSSSYDGSIRVWGIR